MSEAAWRALALRRAAQFTPYPPAGDTAGRGHATASEPAPPNKASLQQDRRSLAGNEGRTSRARLRATSWTLLADAPGSESVSSGLKDCGCRPPKVPRSARRMLRLQENVIPSQGDFRIDTRPSNQGAIRDHPGHRCALRALCAEHRAHRCSIAVFRARHVAPVRLAVAAADPRAAFDVLVRRRDRARRRRAARARSFHPAGGADHVRRDGIRLFHQPRAGGLFPDPQPRRRRHSLLLHLSHIAFAGGGPWSVDAADGGARFNPRRSGSARQARCIEG